MSAAILDEPPGNGRKGSSFDPRLSLAVGAGKLALFASRRLGLGGGTALPGVIANRLDQRILDKLVGDLPRGVTLITGTNGKTTTSRLLVAMLTAAGWQPVHNRTGANLVSGLTTALLARRSLLGRTDADSALLEVDEAVMAQIAPALQPRVLILTNLFRDQLDRYGEVDFVARRWREAIGALSPATCLVLNADDPAVAALGVGVSARVIYYGIDAPGPDVAQPGHVADSKDCPCCGAPLRYQWIRYAHLGEYTCPSGDFVRPRRDVAVRSLTLQGVDSSQVEVHGPFGTRAWTFTLPGLYNVYNLLAATAGALALGIPIRAIDEGITSIRAAFGRLERIPVGDRTLCVALIKNPVGFSEVLRTILAEPGPRYLAILINDHLADGTDVSWLWDADVEALAERCAQVTVSGTRAGDLALRLKYAGIPTDRIQLVPRTADALEAGLASLPPGETLYVLPTYTAMIELRTQISRRGYASRYWET